MKNTGSLRLSYIIKEMYFVSVLFECNIKVAIFSLNFSMQ